jgi:hypothetical protein
MTQKTNPWTFDVRVRERNLKAGTVTDKDVEKYLGGLPDLADQSEPFGTSQPALAQPIVEDLADDEDEDEDDDQDEVEVQAQAPAAAQAAPAPAPAPAAAPEAAPATSDEPSSSPE